jgi:UDPglucose 6-dehydrogenase
MELVVVGTGYVGLVAGTCFAETGHTVTCIDNDEAKIAMLRRGQIPIYEPQLEDLVKRNVKKGRLFFSAFIAVGTPPGEDGSADLRYVLAVAKEIGETMQDYLVVITKSTVPVGTAEKVKREVAAALQKRGAKIPFDVASNPEFLKEGAAIDDFMKPDRIVCGVESERAEEVLARSTSRSRCTATRCCSWTCRRPR